MKHSEQLVGLSDVAWLRQSISEDMLQYGIEFANRVIYSEYSAANIYLFRKIYEYRRSSGRDYLLNGRLRDGRTFSLPKPSIAFGARSLELTSSSDNRVLYPISTDAVERCKYSVSSHRDLADYLYDTATLRNLSGTHFKRARQGLRSLNLKHLCVFRDIQDRDAVLVDDWLKDKSLSAGDADSIECQEAILRLGELGLKGITAEVDGKPSGLVIYDDHLPGAVIVLFLKTRTCYPYLIYALYQELARSLPPSSRLNLCQDLGHIGLRKKKMMMVPTKIAMKFSASVCG